MIGSIFELKLKGAHAQRLTIVTPQVSWQYLAHRTPSSTRLLHKWQVLCTADIMQHE